MEAFSLLKYWRGSGLAGGGGGGGGGLNNAGLPGDNGGGVNVRSAKTIIAAVADHISETDTEENGDDGPFFDLEFAVPDDDDDEEEEVNGEHDKYEQTSGITCAEEDEDSDDDSVDDDSDVGEDDERELKFTLSSGSSGDSTDPNVSSFSPSDDLFFKGRLVPIETASTSSETNSKPQFPVKLLKSATKFRVMMLKFKKSKPNPSENAAEAKGSVSVNQKEEQKMEPEETKKEQKFLTVKFKVEEVPIVSLFMRDNSSKSTNNKSQKQNVGDSAAAAEKKFSKEAVQRYLKKVKPLYVRVSKRYGEKLRFPGQLAPPSEAEAGEKSSPPLKAEKEPAPEVSEAAAPACNVKSQKQSSLPAGLREVCKHLGKSRSASAAVAAAPNSAALSSKRRDDSLLQQQDGIQSAILHCKSSFKASKAVDSSPAETSK